jgi:NAD+-dependent protein deacetylase SIR2
MLGDDEAAPPAKKRRISSDPKPRTTQYLDLAADSATFEADQKEQYDKLLKVLSKSRKIVVVAGAGISVSAGIPDFRSSKGLFKSLKKQHNLKSSGKDLFDASVYKDADSTQSFHQMLRELSVMSKNAQPSPFHNMLATLAEENRLLRLYTQNVDGLDTMLSPLTTSVPLNRKGPWPKTIQLHGGLQKMVCSKCSHTCDFQADLFDGPEPPSCELCEETDNARTEHAGKRSHGIGRMRPRMVLYNEHNPDDEAIGAVVKSDLRTRPDALIVVGTTLKIPGVKRIVKEMGTVVRGRREGPVIWINVDSPPPGFDWDLIVSGPCDRVAEEALMTNWDPNAEHLHDIDDTIFTEDTPATPSKQDAQQPTPSHTPLKAESIDPPTPTKSTGDLHIPSFKRSMFKLVSNPGKKPAKVTKPRAKAPGAAKPKKQKDIVSNNKKIGFTMAKNSSSVSLVGLGKDLDSKTALLLGAENQVPDIRPDGLNINFANPMTPTIPLSDQQQSSTLSETGSISPTTGRPRKSSLEFILN